MKAPKEIIKDGVSGSWMIVNLSNGKCVCETYSHKLVTSLRPDRAIAVPAAQYLGQLNRYIRDNGTDVGFSYVSA